MCHLRREDTFQITELGKKGSIAERVSTETHNIAIPNPSSIFTSDRAQLPGRACNTNRMP